MNFRAADHQYTELKQQLDAGAISNAEFDEQREMLKVRDTQGRWWAKGRQPNAWYYFEEGERGESKWIRGTPPGYRRESERPASSQPKVAAQPQQQSSTATGTQQQSSNTGLKIFVWTFVITFGGGILLSMCGVT
jgi:hypothetical protein